ncbi:hypothetical protein ACRALDRAFT_208161 [Sodiomyces alcalophilus JCM 7366]|uniref:uncharacterized protein n=1 Tax=Sodiomyces alcalophilus JCM 7366 TaxID=591952 RepID=UPI0039B64A98
MVSNCKCIVSIILSSVELVSSLVTQECPWFDSNCRQRRIPGGTFVWAKYKHTVLSYFVTCSYPDVPFPSFYSPSLPSLDHGIGRPLSLLTLSRHIQGQAYPRPLTPRGLGSTTADNMATVTMTSKNATNSPREARALGAGRTGIHDQAEKSVHPKLGEAQHSCRESVRGHNILFPALPKEMIEWRNKRLFEGESEFEQVHAVRTKAAYSSVQT